MPVGTTVPAGRERDQCCWESMVGEEFLKVVIIDFGAVLLAVLFADVCREVVTRRNKFVREKVKLYSVVSLPCNGTSKVDVHQLEEFTKRYSFYG